MTAGAVAEVLDTPGLSAYVDAVERALEDAVDWAGRAAVAGAGAETLRSGGKRLRPMLVYLSVPVAGRDRPALVAAGCAVELVHMATLVHDDVLDEALLRRGRPTVYASDGRDRASETGDFLFARAFGLLAGNRDPAQVRILSDASVALARGELEQREDAYATDVDVERYVRRCELKTASLFAAACRLGGLASGREPEEVEALGAYGRKVGLAFQMLDDLLDVSGPVERTGKHRGADLLDGTVTLPLILAREADPALAELDLRAVTEREQAEAVCDRIAATGALESTRERARELVEQGKQELRGRVDPALEAELETVADRVVERYA